MKVILIKNIKKVGSVGDIKTVADGYAINFLFPQGLAKPATVGNVNGLKKDKKKAEKQAEDGLLATEKIAERLNGMVIELTGKCNEEGTLYASISSAAIVKCLRQKGVVVKPAQINPMEPIKELGEHSVFIVLDHNLEAEITVIVN